MFINWLIGFIFLINLAIAGILITVLGGSIREIFMDIYNELKTLGTWK